MSVFGGLLEARDAEKRKAPSRLTRMPRLEGPKMVKTGGSSTLRGKKCPPPGEFVVRLAAVSTRPCADGAELGVAALLELVAAEALELIEGDARLAVPCGL